MSLNTWSDRIADALEGAIDRAVDAGEAVRCRDCGDAMDETGYDYPEPAACTLDGFLVCAGCCDFENRRTTSVNAMVIRDDFQDGPEVIFEGTMAEARRYFAREVLNVNREAFRISETRHDPSALGPREIRVYTLDGFVGCGATFRLIEGRTR